MSKTGIYQDQIQGIFSEIEKASQIAVTCNTTGDIDIFTGRYPLVITSVNRCKSPKSFGLQIRHTGNILIDRAMDLQSNLKPADRSDFLIAVNKYFTPLINRTIQLAEDDLMAGTTTLQTGTRWLFKKGVVKCNSSAQLCSREEDEIRLYTWKYAHAWRKAVKETRSQINLLASLVNYFPVQHEAGPAREFGSRIVVRSNVPRLATLARLFFENNSFGMSNKRELCNCLCKSFTTPNRDVLSPVSFRNKFDSPERDTIEYWISELTALLRIARQIEKRYN